MRAHWHALHTDLVRSSNRLSFQSDFKVLRTRQVVLRGIRDPAELCERLWSPGGDSEAKNAILLALVAEARDRTSDTATILMILALWPGLDAVYGRLWRHFRSEPDRLVSEIAARITRGIRAFDPTRARRVAATLIRNVERDIRRMLAADWARADCTEELTDAAVASAETALFSSCVRAGSNPDIAVAALTEQLTKILGAGAALVIAIVVEGYSQQAAAETAGLTYEAARKRYQRALTKLRHHPDFLNGSCPNPGTRAAFDSQTPARGAGPTRGSENAG